MRRLESPQSSRRCIRARLGLSGTCASMATQRALPRRANAGRATAAAPLHSRILKSACAVMNGARGSSRPTMWAYLIRRLWQMVPTLIGVVLLVFLLFKFFGADPAVILGGLNATPEQVAAIRTQ